MYITKKKKKISQRIIKQGILECLFPIKRIKYLAFCENKQNKNKYSPNNNKKKKIE